LNVIYGAFQTFRLVIKLYNLKEQRLLNDGLVLGVVSIRAKKSTPVMIVLNRIVVLFLAETFLAFLFEPI
jgi:hypothetical protein